MNWNVLCLSWLYFHWHLFLFCFVFLPVFYFITFHVPFHFVTQHPPLTRNDIAAHCSSADQCPLLVKSDGTAKMPTHYDAAANMTQFCSHFPTKGSAFILVWLSVWLTYLDNAHPNMWKNITCFDMTQSLQAILVTQIIYLIEIFLILHPISRYECIGQFLCSKYIVIKKLFL